MKLHEYESKEILKTKGFPVARGVVSHTADIPTLEGNSWVVKAQIHAGGRGKAGGIRKAFSQEEAALHAKTILGSTLVTPQTGEEGEVVKSIYIEEMTLFERELYLSMMIDRSTEKIVIIASASGGVDIEEVAKLNPGAITKICVDCNRKLPTHISRILSKKLSISYSDMHSLMTKLFDMFIELDVSMIEINPLAVKSDGGLFILDTKMIIDDNALYRQGMSDNPTDPMEQEAKKYDLSYIALDGSIGCMVNGAGLAMATMDIIKLHGGSPANFLDVGGGATQEKVAAAFRIVLSDPKVKAVLVNIFGGIMRCDVIARGIIDAATSLDIKVPVVVRLEGTNSEIGRKILAESGLNLTPVQSFSEAASIVVQRSA
jgi:succinyl-CoA synthetase beta subunit